MTSPAVVKPVEDLVKDAIKDALTKRVSAEKATIPRFDVDPLDLFPHVEVTTKKVTTVTPEFRTSEKHMDAKKLFPLLAFDYNFPVAVYKPEDWDERIRAFIPVVDPDYVLDATVTKDILLAWENNEKVLVYGPTAAGKSSCIEQLCAHTCRPFFRLNCTGDMDSSMIFGQQQAKDGSTYWTDGTLTEAVRYGAVFAWDEWDVTPSEISMGLQWLLEENGKLFLKEMPGTSADKFITPEDRFRIVALGNTQGQGDDTGAHSGTNVQNTATLDRFGTTVRMGYMVEAVECKMLNGKFPGIPVDWIKNLVKFANLIRQGYSSGQLTLTMSPRALQAICKKYAYGYALVTAIDLSYTNKLTETQQKVSKELFRKIYGTKTS